MSDQIITVTVQAALFSAVSTTLAQALTMYQQQKFFVDPTSFIKFIIIAICTTPPNYLYQRWLEDTFPSRPEPVNKKKTDEKTKQQDPSLSVPNTIAKFLLEQSIGAAVNTAVFLILAGLLSGKSVAHIGHDIEQNFFSMLLAGWRVWPMVTLLNLIVIPFEYRMLVGNTAGVLWGVYVNMQAM